MSIVRGEPDRWLPQNGGVVRIRRFQCTIVHSDRFEWDPRKAAVNVRKHGIQFADAIAVLEDDRAITLSDDVHGEERWVTIGMDALARILTVAYAWRDNTIRVISARPATPNERRQYLENS